MELYCNFTADDQKYLVTLPKGVDESLLKEELEKEKIFLAWDDETQKIVSLVKIFLFHGSDVNDTLENELRCIGQNKKLISSKSLCTLRNIEVDQKNNAKKN